MDNSQSSLPWQLVDCHYFPIVVLILSASKRTAGWMTTSKIQLQKGRRKFSILNDLYCVQWTMMPISKTIPTDKFTFFQPFIHYSCPTSWDVRWCHSLCQLVKQSTHSAQQTRQPSEQCKSGGCGVSDWSSATTTNLSAVGLFLLHLGVDGQPLCAVQWYAMLGKRYANSWNNSMHDMESPGRATYLRQ